VGAKMKLYNWGTIASVVVMLVSSAALGASEVNSTTETAQSMPPVALEIAEKVTEANATEVTISNDQGTKNLGMETPIKESEIPVLASVKKDKIITAGSSGRVFLSLLIIGLLAGGMYFFSKWYTKKNHKDADTNRIRVLNQHFLGPRKSLAIIRVAGETILIGVTDQNISMIKALSLIDDEIPETVPASFAKTLKNADSDVDEYVVNNIKDKISTKLKDMRTI